MNELIAAVVGGFLAAGSGWFLQYRLESARLKRAHQLLLLGICDDLKASLELFARVLDEWDKTHIVWFTTINELRESRQIYLKNREWLIMINEENLRQKIFRYYHRSADHINLLENQQRRKYDIQAKLNDLVRDLQLRDPKLNREKGLEQALALMQAEDQELVGINSTLPQNIQRIRDFKDEAKDLLTTLSR
jgi:hypothetical protein